MKILFTIYFILWSLHSLAQDVKGTLSGSISMHLLLGSQFKAVNFGFSVFGTSTYRNASIEGGINLTISPFIQKYGVYRSNVAGNIEMFGLLGYGKNDNLLGSNIGLNRPTAFFDITKTKNRFYGIGGTVNITKLTGELGKFGNAQGGILLRFSKNQNSFTINVSNDATAPFVQAGTDKGFTARVLLKYTTVRNEELYGVGIGMDMFTPEADYSLTPRNKMNSDDGMRAVSYNTKPFDDLFHFNLFLNLSYQSDEYNFDGRLGVDNPKMGAAVQNKLHDGFGLYPRFSWPITEKGKFYMLTDFNKSTGHD